MKKAKKYLGRKVFVKLPHVEGCQDFEKKINIVRSFENFKNDIENEMYSTIELLENNITLYYCDIRKTNNLANLCDIKNHWAKGIFDYREFFTKEEIKKMLENDYLVAVEGLQEIDLEDLDKLE